MAKPVQNFSESPDPQEIKILVQLFGARRYAEALPLAEAMTKRQPQHGFGWKALGVVLKQLGRGEEALLSMQKASSLLPMDAEAQANLAHAFDEIGRFDEALDVYRRMLEINPQDAGALSRLGVILKEQGRLDAAVDCYRQLLKINPGDAHAHNNLGFLLKSMGQVDASLTSYQRAVELNPEYAIAYFNLGNTLHDLGQLHEAEASYRRALKIQPGYVEAHNNLSIILLATGQFQEGWREYWWRIVPQQKRRFPGLPTTTHPVSHHPPELLASDLRGVKIRLFKDQGLGDELFYLRFVPALKARGAIVSYVPDRRIGALVHRINLVDSIGEGGEVLTSADHVMPVGDLPLMLGMANEADIPPSLKLPVLSDKQREVALRLEPIKNSGRPIVGLTWRGGVSKEGLLSKEMPIEQLAYALRAKEAAFVSVQRHPRDGEIAAIEKMLGRPLLDLGDLNGDLESMLALMDQLDDYIGVSNTNMHLRACVGKTAHVLVPHVRDFRWMADGNCSPWFPGFSVYRKDLGNNSWDTALQELQKISFAPLR